MKKILKCAKAGGMLGDGNLVERIQSESQWCSAEHGNRAN